MLRIATHPYLDIELQIVEASVDALHLQQLLVGPTFDDAPVIQNHDPIRTHHRRQTVCDHQRGSTLHQVV